MVFSLSAPNIELALGVTFLIVALPLFFKRHKLTGKYADHISELQADAWSDFATEITEIVMRVDNDIPDDPRDEPDGPDTRRECFLERINQELSREEFEAAENYLSEVDEPRDLFMELKKYLRNSLSRFAIGGGLLVISGLLRAASNSGFDLNNLGEAGANFARLFAALTFAVAVLELRQAWKTESKLDSRTDEFRFE